MYNIRDTIYSIFLFRFSVQCSALFKCPLRYTAFDLLESSHETPERRRHQDQEFSEENKSSGLGLKGNNQLGTLGGGTRLKVDDGVVGCARGDSRRLTQSARACGVHNPFVRPFVGGHGGRRQFGHCPELSDVLPRALQDVQKALSSKPSPSFSTACPEVCVLDTGGNMAIQLMEQPQALNRSGG